MLARMTDDTLVAGRAHAASSMSCDAIVCVCSNCLTPNSHVDIIIFTTIRSGISPDTVGIRRSRLYVSVDTRGGFTVSRIHNGMETGGCNTITRRIKPHKNTDRLH